MPSILYDSRGARMVSSSSIQCSSMQAAEMKSYGVLETADGVDMA